LKKIILLFFSLPLLVFGQKSSDKNFITNKISERISKENFMTVAVGSTDTNAVKSFLLNTIENLKTENITIKFDAVVESPVSKHFTLHQYYYGIKIYNSQIKVNMDLNGNVLSVFDNSYFVESPVAAYFPSNEEITNHIPKNNSVIKKEFIYYYFENKLIPATKVDFTDNSVNNYELIIDNNGNLIQKTDLNRYYNSPQDTTVSAGIFLPDPLTSAQEIYGKSFIDANDSDTTALNSQIVIRPMKAKFDDGIFKLESPFAIIVDNLPPFTNQTTSTSPSFQYTRKQDEFEDVNAFYHINFHHDYLQSIGYGKLTNYPIKIDTHANLEDNSFFLSSPPQLCFGIGGVDDAEDADVIIHEYTHAILSSAAPATFSGSERMALEEGICDYFAASYSKSISDFNWESVYSWDGHNEFWKGRTVKSNKHYPENLNLSKIYSCAEIFSATITQIHNSIGRETTDKILLQSAYSYAANMTMPQAAKLFLQADSLLNGGANYTIAVDLFRQRGILDYPVGMEEFRISEFQFRIYPNPSDGKFVVEITNLQGFKNLEGLKNYDLKIMNVLGEVVEQTFNIQHSTFIIDLKEVPSGIYFLKIQTEEEIVNFKLVKF